VYTFRMNLKKKLKPIKKTINSKNRPFITIRQLYTHLSDLTNEEILAYYQVSNIKALERHIEYIKKILKNRTDNYKEELAEIEGCFCVDSRGEFKYLYSSKKEAEQQVEYSFKTKKIKLKLYPCPYHCGWHISRI